MLIFERVFEVFADYLKEDPAIEIVKVKHGYVVMFWDEKRDD